MSEFIHKENTGSLFKNDKKENEKQPDYKGKINIRGEVMEIALWVRESSKGTKYLSARVDEEFKPVGESKMQKAVESLKQDFPDL